MAPKRIEWAERMVELWNAGDLETWFDEVGPDFVFSPDPSFPDSGVYSGEEFREWMREWTRTWKYNQFEMLGFEDRGDVGLIRSRWHLAAPESGEVPVADFTLVVFWEGPEALRPHRMAAFFDRGQAEEAAAAGTG